MTFVSYAQNFEDVLLWRAFRDIQGGSYLDIGAQDPIQDSVSLAFYEAGWRGTHVEPTPFYAAKLREARPDETVIEAAVSQSPGPLEFHEFPDTGLSTGMAEIAEKHQQSGFHARAIVVAAIRLDRLLELTGEVHWMKIDVEGMEAEVIASWGASPVRPWVLVVEATAPSSQQQTDHLWRDLVVSRGYREVHFDGLSRYFIHETHAELETRFAAPANVFDGFSIARHHPFAGVLRGELAASEQRALDQADDIARLNEELLTTQQRLIREQREQELALHHAHEKELIEARWRERQAAEEQLRGEARETEEALRSSIAAAEAVAAETKAELARFQERAVQLEDKLARADEASKRADERVADALQQLMQANQDLAAAHASAARADAERDQAWAEHSAALAQAHETAEQLRAELGREIERYRGALAEANRLISNAVAEPRGRWQRIGEALGLARPRPAWQALASWSLPATGGLPMESITHQPTEKGPESAMTSSAPGRARNPYLRANSLSELLSWHDVDFVRCAYVTVLGRQPDSSGEAYYTDRIRQGHSKMEVLWQLRKSPEGPRHDPGIAGFDKALKRAVWGRKRFVGQLLRPFNGFERDSSDERRHRALSNMIVGIDLDLRDIKGQVQWLTSHLMESRNHAQPVNGLQPIGSVDIPRLEQFDSTSYRDLSPATQRIIRKLMAD